MSSGNYVEDILDGIGSDPGRIVFHQPDGRVLTAAEVADLIHRTAHVLRGRGVRHGSTVAMMSGNRAEVQTTRYASNLLGARIVALNKGMSPDTLGVIAADVEADILVADAECAADAARVAERAAIGNMLTFEELLELVGQAPDTPIDAEPVRPDEAWCVRHTGGTTGHPKGILVNFGQYRSRLVDPRWAQPATVMLIATSISHLAGLMADSTLVGGGSVVIHAGFDPAMALDAIEKHRVNLLWLLPTLLYRLTDEQLRRPRDTSSLRTLLYGGTTTSPTRLAQAVEAFGLVFMQYYGQAEAGVMAVLMPEDHGRPELLGSAGRVRPGMEIRIVDTEDMDLPPGVSGEIIARTDDIFAGYINNPELTAQVLRNGWVHTGDVGFFDAEGYLHIHDRLKDMIIVVGGHVYPTEVEDVLLRHPAIAGATVFGIRDADGIEKVCAALVPRPGASVDRETVRAHVAESMGTLYVPDAVTVLAEIPLTHTGKPDKNRLAALLG